MKKNYKRRYEFQQKTISRQTDEIEYLKSQIEKLKLQCEEKDKVINVVDSLREELTSDIAEVKKSKDEYNELVKELREMRNVINREVFKGRWRLVRLLIK